jgi:hypothetical protein
MMHLLTDWQFWVVTILALTALFWMLRNVLPRNISPFASRERGRSATLTIGGKVVDRKKRPGRS